MCFGICIPSCLQVVYSSATDLVMNTFTFDQNAPVAAKFKERGLFSLTDLEKAASGRTDNLFTLTAFVELMKHHNILAPIRLVTPALPSPQQATPTTMEQAGAEQPLTEEYFMPSVLQSARAEEMKVVSSKESDPAPLMLCYDCGYTPTGVFTCTIANLVSHQDNWKMFKKKVYKNMASFHVGHDKVTLMAYPRYLEVVVSCRRPGREQAEALCRHVREVLQATLANITSNMKRKLQVGYRFGFECPTHPGRGHLCVVLDEEEEEGGGGVLECLQDEERLMLSDDPRKLLWFPCTAQWFPCTAQDTQVRVSET